jgi:hypothetical protein
MRTAISAMVVLFICLALTSPAIGAGGLYVDSVKVTNGGTTVLADKFEKLGLSDWNYIREAWIECNEKKTECALLLNDGADTGISCANKRVSIPSPALIDYNVVISIAPLEEQLITERISSYDFEIKLFAKDSKAEIDAEITMYQSRQPSRLAIRISQKDLPQGQGLSFKSAQTNLVTTGKWIPITFRLDPYTNTATILINGKPAFSRDYDPDLFPSIYLLGMSCTFGDGLAHSQSIHKG